MLIEPSHSYSIVCVRLSLPSLPLKVNSWRARNTYIHYFYQIRSFGKTFIVQIIDCHLQYITTLRHYGFICNCSSMCFRLLVVNKCFKSLFSIIKLLRDISFLDIMFCCQFPFMPYAKYKKNWVLFFGIAKPGKVLEPRGLTTAFFLSKLFHWKTIIRTRQTLYWNAFVVFAWGVFLIYMCYSWTSDSVRWDEEDVSTVEKEDGSSVDKGAEQDRLR